MVVGGCNRISIASLQHDTSLQTEKVAPGVVLDLVRCLFL